MKKKGYIFKINKDKYYINDFFFCSSVVEQVNDILDRVTIEALSSAL